MITEKEFRELKENKFTWKITSIILLISLLFMGIADYYYDKGADTKLEECKYELRKSNWNNDTLNFCYECEDTKDIKFTSGIKGCWGFNSHGDYINAINVLKDLNCKVTLNE